jgi:hypothetical protein
MTNPVDTQQLYALTDDEIEQVTGGAKKTAKADTRKFEEYVRDNVVTDAEYWNVR